MTDTPQTTDPRAPWTAEAREQLQRFAENRIPSSLMSRVVATALAHITALEARLAQVAAERDDWKGQARHYHARADGAFESLRLMTADRDAPETGAEPSERKQITYHCRDGRRWKTAAELRRDVEACPDCSGDLHYGSDDFGDGWFKCTTDGCDYMAGHWQQESEEDAPAVEPPAVTGVDWGSGESWTAMVEPPAPEET